MSHVKSSFLLSITASVLLLSGCQTLPKTSVVLVEDPNGKVGRVLVENNQQQVEDITTKNMLTVASSTKPMQVKQLTQAQVDQKFATIIANQPTPPKRVKLHFNSGSAEVVTEDLPLIDEVVKEIKSRPACDNSVIGNSDSEGDYESNKVLSMQRAEEVAKMLEAKGVARTCLDLRFYADNDPIVKTAKGVGHPLNRRVEVEIR